MSDSAFGAQELSNFFTAAYCGNAAAALAVYDWLLCLGEEVTFIWKWRSQAGFTLSFVVYAFTRYGLLIELLLSVATNFPMSDMAVVGILGTIAFSSFSALRAYALSNRNVWLTVIIILFALPPMAMNILQVNYLAPANLPSPFNCGASSGPPLLVFIRSSLFWRGSQLLAELLVIGVTWWYSYKSYRIRKGVKLGKTVSSLLLYNGSIYFLFLAVLYMLDIILSTAAVPDAVAHADSFLTTFYDPITSILTCRFILLLRQFDSHAASAENSLQFPDSRAQRDTSSVVLEFAAQPGSSLPASIASFAHPVYVDSAVSEIDFDEMVGDGFGWRDADDVAPTREEGAILPESGST